MATLVGRALAKVYGMQCPSASALLVMSVITTRG